MGGTNLLPTRHDRRGTTAPKLAGDPGNDEPHCTTEVTNAEVAGCEIGAYCLS
jgi:hypothetical protein